MKKRLIIGATRGKWNSNLDPVSKIGARAEGF